MVEGRFPAQSCPSRRLEAQQFHAALGDAPCRETPLLVRDRIEPNRTLVDILARRGAAFVALRNALAPLWTKL